VKIQILRVIYKTYALNKSQSIICEMSFTLNIIIFMDYLSVINLVLFLLIFVVFN